MTNAPVPPPIPPQPLDYRGDPGSPGFGPSASAARAASIFSLARFIAGIAVMAILLVIFLLIIPRLETVYNDFGTKLPWITQLVLDISRFLHTPLGWVAAAVITCIVAVTLAVLPIPRRWLRLLITLIMALIVILLALAVLLPMINLMDAISNGKK
jgi:type II secretory pathway component PulF